MIIFPAIDLKSGACVRLKQGDMNRVTIFNDNPVNQAQIFEKQGFSHLHLVDLEGAFRGQSVNVSAVEAILEKSKVYVQLGGGIRDLAMIESWLSKGVSRVILGTVAVRNPDLVKQACKMFPDCIAVAMDALEGHVAVEGWAETSHIQVLELGKRFENVGVSAIIYTDIGRDGMLQGVNLSALESLAQAISVPIIASGGVAGIEDIKSLQALEHYGVTAVIAGRAFYENRLDAMEILQLKGVW